MKSKKIKVYDWFDIQKEICKKMGITKKNFTDLKGSNGHFYTWCDEQGYGQKDPAGFDRGSSQIWYKEYNKSPTGKAACPPYINLWHLALDSVVPDEMHNDSIVTMFAMEDYEEYKDSYTEGLDWKEKFFNAYNEVMLKIDPDFNGVNVNFSW